MNDWTRCDNCRRRIRFIDQVRAPSPCRAWWCWACVKAYAAAAAAAAYCYAKAEGGAE